MKAQVLTETFMSRKLIAGNWKMNGGLVANEALVEAMLAGIGQPAADVALCAPAPYLAQLQSLLQGSPIAWGRKMCPPTSKGPTPVR